mmetsp:Transcript_19041/g.28620  ORF Transcript_19041/g.28620 Transcript_19041/m.28620 type:complete len:85 (-) Transcript_19041:37-291(-)|eukprot:CAMPEP_0195020302 /NCGR_PEP_ID=MMETSP0326_2-20130528/34897_1 /TAXON_ID=2866 ORGANISM="Crypthecodinium cohnii, Strain Seligo" /NCGR_SAMPLE_ID=MMETSP0326_2 /ASSEMBLY_ACC=CAM_ASM_000348 /LENGTH=84 /DNA_ID=CAMNT_0040038863 /DNA_START=74 /DNA_END=328 /DNA_ORIENTATION=+
MTTKPKMQAVPQTPAAEAPLLASCASGQALSFAPLAEFAGEAERICEEPGPMKVGGDPPKVGGEPVMYSADWPSPRCSLSSAEH